MTDLQDPIKSRSGHLGYLTRLYSEIATLTSQQDSAEKLVEHLTKLETQFAKYNSVHRQCIDNGDEQQQTTLHDSHQRVVEEFERNTSTIKEFLSNGRSTSHSHDDSSNATEIYNPNSSPKSVTSVRTQSSRAVQQARD